MVVELTLRNHLKVFRNGLHDFLKKKTWSWTCKCGKIFYDIIEIQGHLIDNRNKPKRGFCIDYQIARKEYINNRRIFLGADPNLPLINFKESRKGFGTHGRKRCPFCKSLMFALSQNPVYSCPNLCISNIHGTILQNFQIQFYKILQSFG